MKQETWIWTELLAFDREKPDYGVEEYLERIGFPVDGITFLLSSMDFILLHDGMEKEHVLFPDVCSRQGHEENEERKRQEWTNYELRGLIAGLKKHGIKVFCSIFILNMHDRYHKEWGTAHPELRMGDKIHGIDNAFSMLARLKDGTLFEDIFLERLSKVVPDYDFDGWHGPDGQGPGWNLTHSDSSDQFVFQFAEYLGDGVLPAEFLREMDGSEEEMARRLDYIWKNFNREWADFTSKRWVSLWTKAAHAMHALGREVMINSPFAKSIFESIFYFGLDYRALAGVGIDYVLMETVSTSLALIAGEPERIFDYRGSLAEFKACMPDAKLIFLDPVKDVLENWDALRHVPARLERDTWLLANETILRHGELVRCADGLLTCVGDGINRYEWTQLGKMYANAYSMESRESGEMLWLCDPGIFDPLRDDHRKHGTWPPYHIVSQLVETQGLDISSACTPESLDSLTRPLLVPGFDLLGDSVKQTLLSKKGTPVVLIGNFLSEAVPPDADGVFCTLHDGYRIGCVILNGTGIRIPMEPAERLPEFSWLEYNRFVRNRCPRMSVPEAFWDAAGKLIRSRLPESPLRNGGKGIRMARLKNASGVEQIALYSTKEIYTTPEYSLPEGVRIRKRCGFPFSPFERRGGRLSLPDSRWKICIPPFGMILFETDSTNGNNDVSQGREP